MTLRDGILEAIAARLKTLTGYKVERRQPGHNEATAKLLALLWCDGEEVLEAGRSTTTVQKEMSVSVLVQVREEDAPADLDRNAERYLDQEVGRVETALFARPLPAEDVLLQGWASVTETPSNLFRALLRLTVRYSHNIDNPSALGLVQS